jgi:cell division protein FtsQ
MKLKPWVKIAGIVLLFSSLIGFVGFRSVRTNLQQIKVKIQNNEAENFLEEAELASLINEDVDSAGVGTIEMANLNLNLLENKIKSQSFVANCEVSRDLRGNLIVEVSQNKPLARLIKNHSSRQGGYLGENGQILPLSKRFTARVLLMTGQTDRFFDPEFLKSPEGQKYYDFLRFIDKHEFWKAQIAQIDLDKNGDMTLYTLVGNCEIVFGNADDFSQKLEKLRVFYDQIVPVKGWKAYKKVNLKFADQIVCS